MDVAKRQKNMSAEATELMGKAAKEVERRRALEDLRYLIKALGQGALYLWDPFLSANDILNTLAFCENTSTELRTLTSSKPSKKKGLSEDDDDDDDGTDPEATTRARRRHIATSRPTSRLRGRAIKPKRIGG